MELGVSQSRAEEAEGQLQRAQRSAAAEVADLQAQLTAARQQAQAQEQHLQASLDLELQRRLGEEAAHRCALIDTWKQLRPYRTDALHEMSSQSWLFHVPYQQNNPLRRCLFARRKRKASKSKANQNHRISQPESNMIHIQG
jgi:hypothetical protein